jgi:hypothetical protein
MQQSTLYSILALILFRPTGFFLFAPIERSYVNVAPYAGTFLKEISKVNLVQIIFCYHNIIIIINNISCSLMRAAARAGFEGPVG